MEKMLRQFIEAIKQENQLLTQLGELGRQKREFIILDQVKELDKTIQTEGIAVSNLSRMEGARFKLQEEMAQQWGVETENLSAGVILAKVGEDYPDYFTDLKEEIERLDYNLTSLIAINAQNNELIEQSLDYIATMQALLNGDSVGTYSRSGRQTTDPRPNLNIIDKKA